MRTTLAIAALALSGAAHATLITIDADNFASGTNVSNATAGFNISAQVINGGSSAYAPDFQSIIAADCVDAHYCGSRTGGKQFSMPAAGFSGGNFGQGSAAINCEMRGGWACTEGSRMLQVLFDAPTDYVSFDTHWLSDAPSVYAFDFAGTLLFSCNAYSDEPCSRNTVGNDSTGYFTLLELNRSATDISLVLIGGGQGAARVGSITASVPEPGTLALLGAGLFGAFAARRRRAVQPQEQA